MSWSQRRDDPARQIGKYRLLMPLGSGGMATVYLALALGPREIKQLVVIKVPRGDFASDPEHRARFLDEARIAARLDHPHLVQASDVFEHGGIPHLVMEHLEGQPLRRLTRWAFDNGPERSLPQRLRALADALAGLHHAHELADFDGSPLGIVHRDVAPENVFVTYEGRVKVVDFGVAKATGARHKTHAGAINGRIAYMAPEQLAGDELDRRADVFSAGALLWEELTGRSLWGDLALGEIARRLVLREVPRPRDERAIAKTPLLRICERALAPLPADRYETTDQMRRDLEAVLRAWGQPGTYAELGALVSKAFERERATRRRRIESMLARFDGAAAPPQPRPAPNAAAGPQKLSLSGQQPKLSASGQQPKLSTSGQPPKPSAPEQQPKLSTSGQQPKLSASGQQPKLSASGQQPKLSASGPPSRPAEDQGPPPPTRPSAAGLAAAPTSLDAQDDPIEPTRPLALSAPHADGEVAVPLEEAPTVAASIEEAIPTRILGPPMIVAESEDFEPTRPIGPARAAAPNEELAPTPKLAPSPPLPAHDELAPATARSEGLLVAAPHLVAAAPEGRASSPPSAPSGAVSAVRNRVSAPPGAGAAVARSSAPPGAPRAGALAARSSAPPSPRSHLAPTLSSASPSRPTHSAGAKAPSSEAPERPRRGRSTLTLNAATFASLLVGALLAGALLSRYFAPAQPSAPVASTPASLGVGALPPAPSSSPDAREPPRADAPRNAPPVVQPHSLPAAPPRPGRPAHEPGRARPAVPENLRR